MVVPPNDIPENLLQMEYSTGQFVVRFFGSNDYNWVRRGRVFLYEEGVSPLRSARVRNRQAPVRDRQGFVWELSGLAKQQTYHL